MFPSSSKVKLNAAGMSPESSMLLPEREVANEEERVLLACLVEIYSPTSSTPSEQTLRCFAPDVLYSSPRGEVLVGHSGLNKLQSSFHGSAAGRSITHRLLSTPETLPAGSLLVDQIVGGHAEGEVLAVGAVRSLIVLKRRAGDGLVCSMSEEEGHRRATAPLAVRAASASNFHSPTDNMLSPCTSKLNLAKKKHHTKAKPISLFGPQNGAAGAAAAAGGRMQVRSLGGAGERMSSMEM
ncbi:hypothetical protein BCV69DRAFT_283041 [Microstroma glucosiphilum]|uniref:Uncharacterized protein n=1 Tax=Pseudomicrostroma glucosiphilum TaxID=1684307 RepID=A0A316U7L6_9BASI|nr:hypothetical protein BCV69DRAFT_283041 [Pseudomicrostroma glucosiphilum]PWN20828.1 hypothetical protein BCV69DRAFT_283041 [Pseudomicrostroma glucosiphilum]